MEREKTLEVKNLRVSFNAFSGSVKAIRDISFDLYRGETLAIVGESGSGKSVTVKTIMGILANNAVVEAGQVLFEGRDMMAFDESDYQKIRGKRIALVFQDPLSALNPIMKIGKQITEALILAGKIPKADAKARALELMHLVGIPDPESRYHQYPFQFSGGMRQRIIIAIALASDPDVLICDEPTTALDVTIQAQILELIQDIKRKKSLSIIFITHDFGVVANMADRVAVMYAGKIVEYGTSEEVFYDPRHPYTWALLASMPDLNTKGQLTPIAGTPPNMLMPPDYDAFAPRNPNALKIDFRRQPPWFQISDTHWAATWLLHPLAPKVEMPRTLRERLARSHGQPGGERNE